MEHLPSDTRARSFAQATAVAAVLKQNKKDGVARQVQPKDAITEQDEVRLSEYFLDILRRPDAKRPPAMAAVLDGNASGPLLSDLVFPQ